MTESDKHVKRSVSTRLFAVTCLALLAVTALVGYIDFSTIMKLQTDQNTLQSKYDGLSSQYSNLQTSYGGLQNSTSSIQSQLTDLQSQFAILQSQQNASQSLDKTLQSQDDTLQSQYSSLEANYTKFAADYRKLQPVDPFSYLVFTDGNGSYFAENGTTRAVDYSGTSATKVGQSCLDALANSGGKIVFAGTIVLDAPLIIRKGASNGRLEISGFGPSTQLVVGQRNDGIRIFGDQAFGYGGPYHVVIKDLVLTSETSPKGKYMNNGIYLKNWFDVDIENVMVYYANNAGVFIEDSAYAHLSNVYVEGGAGTEYGGSDPLHGAGIWIKGSKDVFLQQCYSDTNEIGFLLGSSSETNNIPRSVFLTQCESTLSKQKGVSISNADGVGISDSLVEGSNSDGIMIIDSYRINLVNTQVIGNWGNGIDITSDAANMTDSEITVSASTISSNTLNGVGIWSKNNKPITQVNIEGCTIINSGTGAAGNPDQPGVWDGVNINNNATTGGNCKYIKIVNCFLGNRAEANQTQAYGIRSLQNSDYVQVFNNDFFQNLDGNYTLTGTRNSIADNSDEMP